jgi:hypothetical protein
MRATAARAPAARVLLAPGVLRVSALETWSMSNMPAPAKRDVPHAPARREGSQKRSFEGRILSLARTTATHFEEEEEQEEG